MNNGKICIPVCARTSDEFAAQVRRAQALVDLIEMRLDCLTKAEFDGENFESMSNSLSKIYKASGGIPLITTFRPEEHGGNRFISQKERDNFWNAGYETAIADVEEDMVEDTNYWLWFERICSYHNFSGVPSDIKSIFDRLAATDAEIIKIAVNSNEPFDGIPVWKLFESARLMKKDLIPIAMGEAGKWTRILGLAHGAYLTYASLDSGDETAPGQITASDMLDVYRVKELDGQTEVYGIISGDTTYTMSPYIHNAAFRATGHNAVFVPFQVSDLDSFITKMVRPGSREVELNFHGFSVTNPHKQTIIKYLDHIDDAAVKIGAVNTIKISDGKLSGYNTDAPGFIDPLMQKYGKLSDARVAVVGAGGAARACLSALQVQGASVTVFARDLQKATELAADFRIDLQKLETDHSKLVPVFSDFDIVVNATPLGTRGQNLNSSVATADQLQNVKLVYDLVYNPSETLLLNEARKAGAKTVGGFEMLIAQAARQFKIWTGIDPSVDEMAAAARKKLDER